MRRYVALGSSMAAGPGIRPRANGAPFFAGRSARNYPHLVADRLGLELVDVTYSGATTANVLTQTQPGAQPQIEALDGTEDLVTVTIGGNDVGYVPLVFAAGLPRIMRAVPLLGGRLTDQLDASARDRALAEVADSLKSVGRALRQRSPEARVFFVDYLTLLPPPGTAAPPLSDADAATGRHVADELARATAEAAADTGCGLVRAARAQHCPPCVVRRALDNQIRSAAARPSRAPAPQRGRHAGGRRTGCRADVRTAMRAGVGITWWVMGHKTLSRMAALSMAAVMVLAGCGRDMRPHAVRAAVHPGGTYHRRHRLRGEGSQAVTQDAMMAHVTKLQEIADEHGGNRALGSPGYDASVDYVANTLRDKGFDVQTPEFEVRLPYCRRAGPDRFRRQGRGLSVGVHHRHRRPDGVAGELVPARVEDSPGCTASDYDGLPVKGAVVLVDRGKCPFGDKQAAAAERGAVALIVANNVDGDEMGRHARPGDRREDPGHRQSRRRPASGCAPTRARPPSNSTPACASSTPAT